MFGFFEAATSVTEKIELSFSCTENWRTSSSSPEAMVHSSSGLLRRGGIFVPFNAALDSFESFSQDDLGRHLE
jgi:hypothetical protein